MPYSRTTNNRNEKYLVKNDLTTYLRLDYEYDKHLRTIWVGDNNTEIAIGSDLISIGTNLNLHGSNFNVYTGQTIFHGDIRIDGNISSGSAGTNSDGNQDFRVEDDLEVGDNIYLTSDSSIISFGASGDLSLIHTPNDGLHVYATASETNSVNDCLKITNVSSGTVADGFGGTLKFLNEADTGLFNTTGSIDFISTDVTIGSSDGKFVFNIDIANTLTEVMSLDNTGLTLVGDLAVNGDDITTDGNMNLDSGGSLTLDAHDGNFIASKAGTEFSSANSAYAGMILGYTCLKGDGTNISSFEIQNSLTVEDASHKVTFKTPPSENVEIEAIFLVNASSTDTRIAVGLSDSSTYNSVGISHEYDGNAVWFTDDEVDDSLITVKFVLTSSELASIGSDNTFWIGISTDGVTKTAYLSYGVRSAFGIGEHPFIIKATALPSTIYDGT